MDDKRDAVKAAIAECEKQYGKGILFTGTSAPLDIEAIPTGSIALDRAIGVGGIPRGRLTVIAGRESAGKSSLVQHIIAEAQKMGEIAALIDAEHSLDRTYAIACGIDMNALIVCQPDYGEQALDVAESLIRSGGVGVLAIDSVAALLPRSEQEGEMGDQQVGLQARLVSKACRKLGSIVAKSKTALVLTNQLRENIGAYSPTGRTPEVMPGGRALKYYSSVILDMRRVEDLKDGKEAVGLRTKVRVSKNKVASPFKEVLMDIVWGEGIDKATALLDVGVDIGVINKGGSWLTWQDYKWQGRDSARLALRNNPELMAVLDGAVRKAM